MYFLTSSLCNYSPPIDLPCSIYNYWDSVRVKLRIRSANPNYPADVHLLYRRLRSVSLMKKKVAFSTCIHYSSVLYLLYRRLRSLSLMKKKVAFKTCINYLSVLYHTNQIDALSRNANASFHAIPLVFLQPSNWITALTHPH